MTKVMIFTRRNTTSRWRYIAKKLVFAKEVKIIGLLDDGCDVNLMPSFYQSYISQNTAEFALKNIRLDVCKEIIQRCRLLRNLPFDLSLRLVGAMWQVLDQEVESSKPDLLLSFLVDFYPADILERLIAQRGIRFIGLSAGILKNSVTFSALGEYNFVHEPNQSTLQRAYKEISAPIFAPSVASTKKYNLIQFAKTKLFWQTRTSALNILKLLKRDPLNPEYMTTPRPGDDYYVRWGDRKVISYTDPTWMKKIEVVPFDKRVFVGLQYNPECSTDYWVRDVRLANWMNSLEEITKVLTNSGFTIFLKDHPVMFGLRRVDIYELLSKYSSIVFIPYEVTSQELIQRCKTTFTWTGTIGIQAALAGRCPIVSTTYYRTEQDFIFLENWEDIVKLPEKIDDFQLPERLDEIRHRVLYQLCSSSVPASIDWIHFDPAKSDLNGTHLLIDSLNRYLPQFAKPSKPTISSVD